MDNLGMVLERRRQQHLMDIWRRPGPVAVRPPYSRFHRMAAWASDPLIRLRPPQWSILSHLRGLHFLLCRHDGGSELVGLRRASGWLAGFVSIPIARFIITDTDIDRIIRPHLVWCSDHFVGGGPPLRRRSDDSESSALSPPRTASARH